MPGLSWTLWWLHKDVFLHVPLIPPFMLQHVLGLLQHCLATSQ